MQPQQPDQKTFVIDADIGDDDVTLPSLPTVDIPVIETPRIAERAVVTPAQQVTVSSVPAASSPVTAPPSDTNSNAESGGFFGRMKAGLSKSRKSFTEGMVNILIGGKEIDDELLEEVETQLLVADIGVDLSLIHI